MKPATSLRSESGAVIIHVAFALLVLLAFSALAIDYGLMLTARTQAQTAADAGALSGAVSLAYVQAPANPDDLTDPAYARAIAAGSSVARQNLVIGQAPRVNAATDVQIIDCPEPIPNMPDKCVRVNAYRNQEGGANNIPLPTFFAQLVGVDDQGARATATAQMYPGTNVSCVKPWAIPDLWLDIHDESAPANPGAPGTPPTLDDEYELFAKQGQQQDPKRPLPDPDVYIDKTGGASYTGYRSRGVFGQWILLKAGDPQGAIKPGWFNPVVLPDPDDPGEPCNGGDCYREAIATCNPTDIAINQEYLAWDTEPGNMIGPTRQGVRDLLARDPNATLSCTGGQCTVQGSACPASGNACDNGRSARWVPIPVYDPYVYLTSRNSGRFTLKIIEFVGMWVDGLYRNLTPAQKTALASAYPGHHFDNDDVVGRLMPLPASRGSRDGTSTFMRTVVLVR